MDYLVIEGYKSAAEEFSKETGLDGPVDLNSIENRMNIREALQRGDVGDAIARMNDLNPEVSVGLLHWPSLLGRERIQTFHAPRRDLRSMVRLNTKTSVFNMIFVSCFSHVSILTLQLHRSWTPTSHYISYYNNRSSLNIYAKARFRRRSSLLKQSSHPVGRRTRNFSLSLSGRWPSWRTSRRR